MKTQNPFSIYDLLGYLVPGLIFLLGLIFIGHISTLQSLREFSLANFLTFEKFETGQIIGIIVIAYLIGHTLSYMSSLTIEKFSIWTFGYPSKYMLDRKNNTPWHNFYFRIYFRKKIFVRTIVIIFLLPLYIPLIIISLIFSITSTLRKTLDTSLIDVIESAIKNHFKESLLIDLNNNDIDNFRQIYHYVIERYPNHAIKLQNYVALYGFTRTSCLIFNLLTWIIIISLITDFSWSLCIIGMFGMLFSFFYYGAFNKFFRKFSFESMMAITSSPPISTNSYN